MFHLVNKRWLFIAISLMVIVPGAISLIVKGLNVGIDFAGGATVELRPSQKVTTAQMRSLLAPLHFANLQVNTGTDVSIPGNHIAWVRFNRLVDSTVTSKFESLLKGKYGSQLVIQYYDVSLPGNTETVATISNFTSAAKASDIEHLLGKLPDTTKVSTTGAPASATATPTVTATATPGKGTPTATPKATATPPAKATGTPAAGKGSPTPTSTPTNKGSTFPVQVVNVQVGSTTQTISLLTSSLVNTNTLNSLQSALVRGNIYGYIINNASVSPAIAAQTTSRAVLAVLAASVAILLYIWFAFRKVPKPWRYGACAIIALLHDVLVVLGVFSILGWAAHIQIDTLFITALLTVVGFSVHDTIVVFDRIRENMQRRTTETFEQVVNASLVQTMARSLNTSLTVLFTLSALTLFGGDTIRTFTLALLIGIFSGTYSSIFNASMLLVVWEKRDIPNWFARHFGGRGGPRGRERELSERELARTRG